jgi:hypothetical protein
MAASAPNGPGPWDEINIGKSAVRASQRQRVGGLVVIAELIHLLIGADHPNASCFHETALGRTTSMQRMRASRLAQSQIESHWRLARTADAVVGTNSAHDV